MTNWLALALLLVPIAFFFLATRNANRLFLMEVSGGKVRVLTGKLPKSLLSDLKDVFKHSKAKGTLSAVVEKRAVRLISRGAFEPSILQQARNVVGRYPLAKIRAAR